MLNFQTTKLSTDHLMWELQQTLISDLSEHVRDVQSLLTPDVKGLRMVKGYEIPMYSHPYRVKCNLQLRSWLKRYCFADDIFTSEQRSVLTDEKFLSDQIRIGQGSPISYRSYIVVQKARKLIKSVLGTYNEERIYPHCQFSRKAVVGFSGDNIYLDNKIHPGSIISGTASEVKWFDNYLESDPILKDLLKDRCSGNVNYRIVTSLAQVNVAKNASIMRPVRPNTLIGSFRSSGLAGVVEEALPMLGIRINVQQEVHKRLARAGSRRGHNVTMDLSSASDSFTPSLMNRLLPRGWYSAFKMGRTPYVELRTTGATIYSPSFMAMGIGYTFALMTLCYQAILLSIQDLVQINGRISTFGDDLIFPKGMLPYVTSVLQDLGFKINSDKTFHRQPFRESCGGDFYDEVDVRPASPEGMSEVLEGGPAISAYVYKLFNSLIRRWEEVELPSTFGHLREVLNRIGVNSYSVPPHFPDESGFKDGVWINAQKMVFVKNRRKPDYQLPVIPCVVSRSRLRPVGFQGVYYWESLLPKEERSVFTGASWDVLIWKLEKRRGTDNKERRYRRMVAYTTRKGNVYFDFGSIQAFLC